MSGYIGSKTSVTLVDGYTQAEADAEFVQDPNGAITVSGSNVGIGTSSPSGAKLQVTGSNYNDQLVIDRTDTSSKWGLAGADSGGFQIYDVNSSNATRMTIDASGRVTMPYQPYFLANNYGQVKAVGWHLLDFTTSVEHNVGNHYSTSGSKFTAPVAGVYSFSVGGYVPEDNNGQRYAYSFYVNGNGGLYISGGQQSSPDGPLSTHTQKIKLNANDYVQVYMYMPTVTTLGATFHRMWFNGCLIG